MAKPMHGPGLRRGISGDFTNPKSCGPKLRLEEENGRPGSRQSLAGEKQAGRRWRIRRSRPAEKNRTLAGAPRESWREVEYGLPGRDLFLAAGRTCVPRTSAECHRLPARLRTPRPQPPPSAAARKPDGRQAGGVPMRGDRSSQGLAGIPSLKRASGGRHRKDDSAPLDCQAANVTEGKQASAISFSLL